MLACFALVLASGSQDLNNLVDGVSGIGQVGAPGVVHAIGGGALPFIEAEGRPMAVATKWGAGRVVAIGHNGYISPDNFSREGVQRLVRNMIVWASGGQGRPRVGVFAGQSTGLAKALGFAEVIVRPGSVRGVDVLAMTDPVALPDVLSFVRAGGGLVVGATPWGWKQVHRSDTLLGDFGWNEALAPAGIVFGDGVIEGPKVVRDEAAADRLRAASALDRLDDDPAAGRLAGEALRDCPPSASFAKRARSLAAEAKIGPPPLGPKQGCERLALIIRELDGKSPSRDPWSDQFPGLVPDSAKRIARTVALPASGGRWVSTGLYAAPGEKIVATLPNGAAGATLQIGVHSDQNWHHDKWLRHPHVVTRAAFKGGRAELASPFGGLVVVDLSGRAPAPEATIKGAVPAGLYRRGTTPLLQWRADLDAGAPWAELEGKYVSFSVPTAEAKKVADPEALLILWDHVIELYRELDGSPLPSRPERIVADVQIGGGYMHSGYPIMTMLDDSVPLSLSVQRLTSEGTWGHWHELGHNRQQDWWTFDGTVEVTCNLYTLYAMEKVAGKGVMARIGAERAKVDAYLARPDFETWKREPFIALTMYARVIQAFGWDSMRTTFRAYLAAAPPELPKTDAQKRDQWLVRLSRTVGRNLGPYFDAWGVPVSDGAKAQVADLPVWSPQG